MEVIMLRNRGRRLTLSRIRFPLILDSLDCYLIKDWGLRCSSYLPSEKNVTSKLDCFYSIRGLYPTLSFRFPKEEIVGALLSCDVSQLDAIITFVELLFIVRTDLIASELFLISNTSSRSVALIM